MILAALLASAAPPLPASQRGADVERAMFAVCPAVNAGALDLTTAAGRASVPELAIAETKPIDARGQWFGTLRGDVKLRFDRIPTDFGTVKCGVSLDGKRTLDIRRTMVARLAAAGWQDRGAATEVAAFITFFYHPTVEGTSMMVVTLPGKKGRALVSFTLLTRAAKATPQP